MPLSKKPVGRLPQHLQHLKRKPDREGPAEDRPAKPAVRPAKPEPRAAKTETVAASPDRLTSLIPEVLRALLAPHLGEARGRHSGPIVVAGEDILAALAPYWRPRSRFEGLMIAKLVGEGYLRPRGARGKNGFSAAYAVTPKAERLMDLRR